LAFCVPAFGRDENPSGEGGLYLNKTGEEGKRRKEVTKDPDGSKSPVELICCTGKRGHGRRKKIAETQGN